MSYLNSISGNERAKYLRQTYEDTLVNPESNKKEYNISKSQPKNEIVDNVVERKEEVLFLNKGITLSEFANLINVSKNELIEKCKKNKIVAYRNKKLNDEVVDFLAKQYGIKIVFKSDERKTLKIENEISVDSFASLVNVPLKQILKICEKLNISVSVEKN